ncbi:MAG: hypothetical protein ACKOF9_11470 [Burkholderiales bacterium]
MKSYQYALTVLTALNCQWALAQTPAAASNPSQPASAATVVTTESLEPRIIRGNDRVTAPGAAVSPIVGAPSAFNFLISDKPQLHE